VSRPVHLALRFMAIAVALALFWVAFGPPAPAKSPYLSSLSILTVEPTLAATCADRACGTVGNRVRCDNASGFNCSFNAGKCTIRDCS